MLPESEVRAEKRLIAAVMELAVRDVKGMTANVGIESNGMREACQHEARAWLHSEYFAPFSFLWCCDAMDLRPDVMRKGIALMKRQKKYSVAAVNANAGDLQQKRLKRVM